MGSTKQDVKAAFAILSRFSEEFIRDAVRPAAVVDFSPSARQPSRCSHDFEFLSGQEQIAQAAAGK